MVHVLLIGGSSDLRLRVLDALEAVRPESACTVVGNVRGGRRLAAAAMPSTFDLVVLDLALDDADAAVLLVDLHSAASVRPIVAVPAEDRRSDVFGALQLGASGVLAREASADETVRCLRTVLDGGVSMPASLMRAPVGLDAALLDARSPPGAAPSVPVSAELGRLGLTARQTEVLTRLLQGHSNKEIARDLTLSVETIKDHVAAVLRGLGVHSRTQAVLAVERMLRDRGRPLAPTLQSTWQAVAAPRPPVVRASTVR